MGEAVAVVAARRRAAALDALAAIEVDYEPLPVVLDMEAALADGADLVHADKGTNKSLHLGLRLGRGRHRRRRRRGRDRRRRGRHQAALRPAAADPGVHGAAQRRRRPDRRPVHDVVGHPDPAHPAVPARRGDRHARAQGAGDRARRRRRLRRQAPGHARGADRVRRREAAGQAGQVHRVPLREPALGPPRPRRDPGHRARRPARRHACTGLRVKLLANMGAYLGLVDAGRADPRRVHVQRDLQVPRLPLRVHRRVHQHHDHRRLPRRRPAGGHVRDRTDHGRARRRARASTRSRCAGATGSTPRSSRSPPCAGLTYDSGDYEAATDRAMELFGYDELRREQAGPPGRRRHRCSSASASRPTPRCAGWRRRGCSARCATAPAAGRRRACGCCPPARSRWSPARRRTARATRRRGARSSPTSSASPFDDVEVLHGDTRTSLQGARHLRLALARGRRHRALQRLPEGGREGQADRRAHARVRPGRPGVHRRPVPGARQPRRRQDARRLRAGRVRGARPARRHRADARRRRHLRPGQLLLPARHPPVRGRRSTPRPAG